MKTRNVAALAVVYLSAWGAFASTLFFAGDPGHPAENVRLENVTVDSAENPDVIENVRMAARRLALYDIVPYAPGHEAETARDIRETRATAGIDTFPNFAAYRIRFTLAFRGCLPVSKQLPFEWYDTPNIHCVTLKDFKRLCDKEGIEILEVKAESRHFLGKLLLALGFKNLGASKIIARIARMRD
ncbi:MAG: methionine biosynthesis protein MetW [Kiritimatiellia bacterium]|nr:methionine biosynthesis protein MetW [Kiritimatiellia bacterium]